MLHILNTNFNHRLYLLFLGILASIGVSLVDSSPSYAACADDNVPCVEVDFGTPQGGNLSVQPGISYYDSTQFYLPVEISLKNTSVYTVKVYGSGSSLTSGSDTIPTIGTDTAYTDLGKNGSEWGIRWNLGDTVSDKDTNYHKVPASSDDDSAVVVENQSLPKSSTAIKKQLTLGFAVAVDANQPSGSYTNTVTVAVVASPRDARSFFDITNMQDMTTEICQNTTTPAKTATTKFDTDGSHPEDPSYVPETTLTDVRNGRQYLIRKLADGNCWMSQNLSLALSTSTPLTSETTDLNSKASWTPTNSTETSAGIKWGENDGVPHSLSVGWNQYWAGGTTFNASGATAYGGTSGYAQRGVYYNWFAATAGSGKTTDTSGITDGVRIINGTVQDSICPKGWMLPVGREVDNQLAMSFYNLIKVYTGNTADFSGNVDTLYTSPINLAPAGFYAYSSGTVSHTGEAQMYWTSAAGGTGIFGRYFVYADNKVFLSGTNGHKGQGFSIRCVAR